MKELDKKYNHLEVEKDKYKKWIDLNIFCAEFDLKKPAYSIVIPPPNVTGKLHLGHAWDGALQDFLIRFKKLNGFDTLWIPGMDHAGIATQAKVEQRLKEQGISRYDLGREKFIEKVWEWKEEYAEKIRKQWAKLGLGLDYSKEKFTYSEDLNKIVNYIFVEMYKKKLIYKGKKIVNWDSIQKTTISNIEVIYKETKGAMYYFKYFLENDINNFLTVATTRPETMFGDVCLVVNPKDKRYQKYIGKNVINPVNNKIIPIIADEYVEIDFGTGVMKCTPAHDVNDFELGIKYNLEQINVMNDDATMNEFANEFIGLDRFEARKKIIIKLEKENLFLKEEEIIHQVGYSERSNAIIEPLISDQWFVKMKPLAEEVLKLQNSKDKINFFPLRFSDTLNKWMESIHDWVISRQLWWGHQIPVWYHKKTNEIYVNVNPPEDIENWIRDTDVLDTWFSSAFWPFATMQWSPKDSSELMQRYFPTSTLVTGYDIIFFWVARMIFQSLEFTNQKPFQDVLLHGLIRDEKGQKMSKSLGNGIDPMEVIENYGADSLRFFLLTNSSPGQDLRYSEEKIISTWNFVNKIWNASRFVLINIDKVYSDTEFKEIIKNLKEDNLIDKWILNKLYKCQKEVYEAANNYEFTVAGKILYNFIWTEYCSWYIELAKVKMLSDKFNSKDIEITKATLGYVLKQILVMLHPFTPFVTEEIYSTLNLKETILKESWLKEEYNFKLDGFKHLKDIISAIREFRASQNIKNSIFLNLFLNLDNSKSKKEIESKFEFIKIIIEKITNSKIILNKNEIKDFTSIQINDYFIEISNDDFLDNEKIIFKLNEKLLILEKEIKRSKKMLSNENFINKASLEKVEIEKQKFEDYKNQYESLLTKINKIK
ncbi:valine--tRNA ligase [Spiroplasma taiwanense]|uniref:Valine--tRNA ligase n=1 Tax=Spiroplasma taiwanense CT-1 TaxID=1276220 RepID=S5LZS2_9MOLU|nr:valine--tRNA ligase [Spiroplasma taiwanense]AGR41197.1 valyl-tRNA synthetase [Spiroplasma taiwanense CT-1]